MSAREKGTIGNDDDEVDYLLSRGSLGASQRDRIFEALAASVGRPVSRPRRSARRAIWTAAIASGVLGIAACLVLWTRGSSDTEGFRAKGGAPSPVVAASIDMECLQATLRTCARGSTLAFSARGAAPGMFVTAFLDPIERGQRVWLLNNEPVSTQVAGEPGLLARGARVPDDQPPGVYAVEVLVTPRPLLRPQAAELRPGDVVARARFDLTIIR